MLCIRCESQGTLLMISGQGQKFSDQTPKLVIIQFLKCPELFWRCLGTSMSTLIDSCGPRKLKIEMLKIALL